MKSVPRWLGPVGATAVRTLGRTWRVQERFPAELAPRRADHATRCVYVFWHGTILALSYLYRDLGVCIASSHHRDGEMGARIAVRLGFCSVRGSSSRGASRLVRAMIDFAGRAPGDIGLTPDGPRGPAKVAKPGALFLAGQLGWPVVPVAIASRPHKQLGSWDGFVIPYPFARIAVVSAPPLMVAPETSTEGLDELCREVERRMAAAEAQADEILR